MRKHAPGGSRFVASVRNAPMCELAHGRRPRRVLPLSIAETDHATSTADRSRSQRHSAGVARRCCRFVTGCRGARAGEPIEKYAGQNAPGLLLCRAVRGTELYAGGKALRRCTTLA